MLLYIGVRLVEGVENGREQSFISSNRQPLKILLSSFLYNGNGKRQRPIDIDDFCCNFCRAQARRSGGFEHVGKLRDSAYSYTLLLVYT